MKRFIILSALTAIITSCGNQIPQEATVIPQQPGIYPDYTGLTIPKNIAPLNFRIEEQADRYLTVLSAEGRQLTFGGQVVQIPVKKWHDLLDGAAQVKVQVYVRRDGKWGKYDPYLLKLAEEIDPYISYRLIPPSIEFYEHLTINQRSLESFQEKVIYSNDLLQSNENGQCINCHHYRNYKTDNMQFHVRQYLGGTVLVTDGNIRKINLKTDSTLSAGVYPAWHPTHDYIAYSTNTTIQTLHSTDPNRVEVLDLASDLILYNIKENAVSIIENDSNAFECFPAWAPDGKTLYYVSARYKDSFDRNNRNSIITNYSDFHYSLYRKGFDPDTRTWSKSELLVDADSADCSITLPRVSPDGRYLIYTKGGYGIFHIWHRDADLYMMDLKSGVSRPLSEINSPDVESYHSWSSNGKWVIFSTRRDDGAYTRPYITHLNADGTFSKPFSLPQKDPGFANAFMCSYNIPEFMIEPVSITPRKFAKEIGKGAAEAVSFESANKAY